MVTILPNFISTLMTSAAFTDIFCARAATVMVSGTSTSRTTGSGAVNVCSETTASVLCRPPRPERVCQLCPPPLTSPRVFRPLRLADSSFQPSGFLTGLGLAAFSFALPAGLWRVPSVVAFFLSQCRLLHTDCRRCGCGRGCRCGFRFRWHVLGDFGCGIAFNQHALLFYLDLDRA